MNPAALQQQVDRYLASNPGGTQINPTDISYNRGAMVVTVADGDLDVGAADCPRGYVCVYDGLQFTYPRAKFSDCGSHDLSMLGWRKRIESAHFNRAGGSAAFFGRDPETGQDILLFTLSSANQFAADLGDTRNRTNDVYIMC